MVGFRGRVWSRAFKQVDLVEVRHLDETRRDITDLRCRGDSTSLQGSTGTTPFLVLSRMIYLW